MRDDMIDLFVGVLIVVYKIYWRSIFRTAQSWMFLLACVVACELRSGDIEGERELFRAEPDPVLLGVSSVKPVTLAYSQNVTEEDIITYATSSRRNINECKVWYKKTHGKTFIDDAIHFDALFVSYVFATAGNEKTKATCAGLPSSYTPRIYDRALEQGAVFPKQYIREGDLAIIDLSASATSKGAESPDHVGIVTSVRSDKTKVECIEWNSTAKAITTVTWDMSRVVCAIRPYYLRHNHLGGFNTVGTARPALEDGYNEDGVRTAVWLRSWPEVTEQNTLLTNTLKGIEVDMKLDIDGYISNGWAHVKWVNESMKGWICKGNGDQTYFSLDETTYEITITMGDSHLRVRKEANADSDQLGQLTDGHIVYWTGKDSGKTSGCSKGWDEIYRPEGLYIGWSHRDYLNLSTTEALPPTT